MATELQKVEEKFERFKDFIRTNAPSQSMLLISFYQIPLSTFLETIFQRGVKEKLSIKKIMELIFSKCDMNPNDFKEDDIDTLTRYLTYFRDISKIYYS